MQLRTVKLDETYFVDEYDESVKMSTYLVAYVILPNDYISIGSKTISDTQVGAQCHIAKCYCAKN